MGKKKKQEKAEKADKSKKKQKDLELEKSAKAEKKKKSEKKSDKKSEKKSKQKPADVVVKEVQKPAISDTVPVKQPAKKIRSQKPAPDIDIVRAAEQLKAVGDVSRIQILKHLTEQELCAAELLAQMPIVQSTLSHHMKILVESGIVKCRKQGKWSYYSIDREVLALVSESIIKLVD